MRFITIAVGIALSLGVVSNTFPEQSATPQDQTTAPAQPTQRVMPSPGPAMSVAGCLYREWDLPALIPNTPNGAPKPVVLEGYIVADARIVGQGSSAPGHVGGTGGRTYKVEGIPVAQLRALVGKRVEIAGDRKSVV